MIHWEVSNSSEWRESVVYDEHYATWQTGLILTLLASLLSYGWTAKYSDFMYSVREHTRQQDLDLQNKQQETSTSTHHEVQNTEGDLEAAGATPSEGRTRGDAGSEHGSESSVGTGSIIMSTFLQAAKVHPFRFIIFALVFATFVVMDFVALAIVPLALIVPTIMLIFLWGAIYRAIWQRSFDIRTAVETIVIAALIAVGVGVAPKGLYIVHIRRVVNWNAKSIIYSGVFVGVCIFIYLLRRSRPQNSRNTQTILTGVQTGIFGGQALVLLKLVAEICENAIFHSDYTFEGASAVVVVCLSVILSSLHIFSLHTTLGRLNKANVQLLIPVHRLALMGSASIGAGVYLEEWKVPEGSPLRMGLYYGLSLFGLTLACIYFGHRAAKEDSNANADSNRASPDSSLSQRDRRRRHSKQITAVHEHVMDDLDDKEHFHDVIASRSATPVHETKPGNALLSLGQDPHRMSCAATGDDDEELDEYYMSHSRSMMGSDVYTNANNHEELPELALPSSANIATPPAPPSAGSSPDSPSEKLETQNSNVSNSSLQSFHSLMIDDSDEEDDEGLMGLKTNGEARAGGYLTSVTLAEKDPTVFNYNYPVPEETMVYPKSMGTPKSNWVDAGLQSGGWKVRGPDYDNDRVKVPCGEARMAISALEWIYAPEVPHKVMSARVNGYLSKHHLNRKDRPFVILINFIIPSVGHYVTYLTRRPDIKDEIFDEMLEKFINAEHDDYRNKRLKLIPGVLEGSYFVRKAVGAKPALLCQKLTTTYHRGDNFFEIVIDVGSSAIGSRIFSAVKGFASSLVLHLGIVLESKTHAELPERLMVGVDIYTPAMHPNGAPVPPAGNQALANV